MMQVPIDAIKIINGFNPPERTTETALKDLMADIALRGILVDLIINQDDYLVDGWRRLACAKALGMKTVPVKVVPGTVQELWGILAATVRPPSGKDWLHIATQPNAHIPDRRKRDIARLKMLVGDSGLRWLAEQHIGTGIVSSLASLCNYCGKPLDENIPFAALAIRWLVNHKAQLLIRHAMALDIPPRKIIAAIESNVDLWVA
jgi:hypothetical protein